MRVVIQRVSSASVLVESGELREISQGLVILLGISENDTKEDIDWLCKKISNMRIFSDQDGKMNRSLIDINGKALIISQFTLFASVKKGNRPSFIRSAKPDIAIPLYENFVQTFKLISGVVVQTGEFGDDMLVNINNDGPVTITIDSNNKE